MGHIPWLGSPLTEDASHHRYDCIFSRAVTGPIYSTLFCSVAQPKPRNTRRLWIGKQVKNWWLPFRMPNEEKHPEEKRCTDVLPIAGLNGLLWHHGVFFCMEHWGHRHAAQAFWWQWNAWCTVSWSQTKSRLDGWNLQASCREKGPWLVPQLGIISKSFEGSRFLEKPGFLGK